jgi:hypothetical protein
MRSLSVAGPASSRRCWFSALPEWAVLVAVLVWSRCRSQPSWCPPRRLNRDWRFPARKRLGLASSGDGFQFSTQPRPVIDARKLLLAGVAAPPFVIYLRNDSRVDGLAGTRV